VSEINLTAPAAGAAPGTGGTAQVIAAIRSTPLRRQTSLAGCLESPTSEVPARSARVGQPTRSARAPGQRARTSRRPGLGVPWSAYGGRDHFCADQRRHLVSTGDVFTRSERQTQRMVQGRLRQPDEEVEHRSHFAADFPPADSRPVPLSGASRPPDSLPTRSPSSTRRLITVSSAQLGGVAVAGVCLTGWVLAVAGHHLLIWPAWIILLGATAAPPPPPAPPRPPPTPPPGPPRRRPLKPPGSAAESAGPADVNAPAWREAPRRLLHACRPGASDSARGTCRPFGGGDRVDRLYAGVAAPRPQGGGPRPGWGVGRVRTPEHSADPAPDSAARQASGVDARRRRAGRSSVGGRSAGSTGHRSGRCMGRGTLWVPDRLS